jgi:hypothetical protein
LSSLSALVEVVVETRKSVMCGGQKAAAGRRERWRRAGLTVVVVVMRTPVMVRTAWLVRRCLPHTHIKIHVKRSTQTHRTHACRFCCLFPFS